MTAVTRDLVILDGLPKLPQALRRILRVFGVDHEVGLGGEDQESSLDVLEACIQCRAVACNEQLGSLSLIEERVGVVDLGEESLDAV